MDKKNVLLAVKMTAEQQRAITQKARAARMTVPDFIRHIAEQPVEKKAIEEKPRADNSEILRGIEQLLAKHLVGMKTLLDG